MSLRLILRRVMIPAVVTGGSITIAAIYGQWIDAKFRVASTLSHAFLYTDPESAHNWAIWAARKGLTPTDNRRDPSSLQTHLWGRIVPNPIGLAAGFDKNAEVMPSMSEMGFGFVEIGSVTPLPQDGNPKPRVFRLPEQKELRVLKRAVINRYGFNSDGIDAVSKRLSLFRTTHPSVRLGVNLGVNKSNALDWKAAARDYTLGVQKLAKYADYIVINVSSPNTMGLRALQNKKQFTLLLSQVKRARDEMEWGKQGPPPLFVKISADLTPQDRKDIAQVALAGSFDGLIISNTTIARTGLPDSNAARESGGLSGSPLFASSTELLREMYALTKGSIPIIGCGGVSNGQEAYQKIRAGASLVQLYTAMVYEGPSIVPKIKAELAECLKRDHYNSVWEAVGADHRQPVQRR